LREGYVNIFAQAAQALRSPGGVDPLAGLDIERVLAIGASQSAGRMTTYYTYESWSVTKAPLPVTSSAP
jgi:Alpha/beta hydrolase domain